MSAPPLSFMMNFSGVTLLQTLNAFLTAALTSAECRSGVEFSNLYDITLRKIVSLQLSYITHCLYIKDCIMITCMSELVLPILALLRR